MCRLRNFLRRLMNKKTGDEFIDAKSLFQLLPLTIVSCNLFGVPFCSSYKWPHWILISTLLIIRIWCTFDNFKFNLDHNRPGIQTLNEIAFYSISFVAYWFLVRNRKKMIAFLTSEASASPKLRKVDFMWLALFFAFIAHASGVTKDKSERVLVLPNFQLPIVKDITSLIISLLELMFFDFCPHFCTIIYLIAFHVLYMHKLNVLQFICNKWQSKSPQVLFLQLREASLKQSTFEDVFSPFLLISLFANFCVSVYFFFNLKSIFTDNETSYKSVIYSFCTEGFTFGVIFFISCRNERLKELSSALCDHLHLALIQQSSANYCMINHLEKKINEAINEPLTVCKLVTVERQLVLAFVSSCISFSVLFIQINNGALAS